MPVSIDPVCGMNVEETNNALRTTFQGRTFFFCSEECKRTFEANPDHYLSQAA
jgi:YHS domain-containing protein